MSKAAIAEKEKFVDAFAEDLKAAKAILVINYLGLTVEEVTNMRKELRDNGVKMKVVKNTYLRRAAAKAGIEGLEDTFVGPTAVVYTDNADDITEPARIVSKYEDDFDVIDIKGGVLEGKVTSKEDIKALAAIPGREGLLSMLVSVLQAPVRNVAYAINAVADSKDESAE
ncbi:MULTISPECIES: 50S ribosomal protein L10 [Lactobacillus]|uniref:Large ribosomal subunit protein uL10 n=1 Tax=Lactobacillus apis TaxID=303541 RepID=A0A0F4LQL5_9LACO|nr:MULTISPECIES: 50S ribosomal protein L10 [Lactobacillus]AWM74012.1 50S ribosomal protein L10 [Lactobacillus apis]KJY60860.1 50S ribosomal protein L10 [Lactobacillus apis]MBI0022995.1 50S ribosomal protein L10 [Lactobacillus sp. W8172]MCT6865888.1 50S ribosomal protein L10 [Lactobacillus panisapium]